MLMLVTRHQLQPHHSSSLSSKPPSLPIVKQIMNLRKQVTVTTTTATRVITYCWTSNLGRYRSRPRQGTFVKPFIPKGNIVTGLPMHHIPYRNDFINMYIDERTCQKFDEYFSTRAPRRTVKTRQELLQENLQDMKDNVRTVVGKQIILKFLLWPSVDDDDAVSVRVGS